MIRSRPLAVVGSLLARIGLIDAVATWPRARQPIVALSLRDTTSGSWMQPLLPSRARALRSHPRAWQAARARALVLPRGSSVLVIAAERALGRALVAPRVSLYSPSGCAGKVTCFIGESGRVTPTVVVKAMADPRDGWWLREEVHKLRAIRSQLAAELRHALLPAPLFAGEEDEEYVVVEAFCSLDGWCDRSSTARARAHGWLGDFHRSTTRRLAAWGQPDTDDAAASVASAWGMLRRGSAQSMALASETMLRALHGSRLPRCAIHGDFSPGNLARADGQLKVLDWEWASLDGAPYFDLWCYQLAELHRCIGRASPDGLDRRLQGAIGFVEAQLAAADIDREFALATLAPVLAELIVRVRRTIGAPGLWELRSGHLMAAVERSIDRHLDGARGHGNVERGRGDGERSRGGAPRARARLRRSWPTRRVVVGPGAAPRCAAGGDSELQERGPS